MYSFTSIKWVLSYNFNKHRYKNLNLSPTETIGPHYGDTHLGKSGPNTPNKLKETGKREINVTVKSENKNAAKPMNLLQLEYCILSRLLLISSDI